MISEERAKEHRCYAVCRVAHPSPPAFMQIALSFPEYRSDIPSGSRWEAGHHGKDFNILLERMGVLMSLIANPLRRSEGDGGAGGTLFRDYSCCQSFRRLISPAFLSVGCDCVLRLD